MNAVAVTRGYVYYLITAANRTGQDIYSPSALGTGADGKGNVTPMYDLAWRETQSYHREVTKP
jgi:hypothetical protein